MLEQMSDNPDVDVFPEPLSKRPFHGSLTHGIACNIAYALENYDLNIFWCYPLESSSIVS